MLHSIIGLGRILLKGKSGRKSKNTKPNIRGRQEVRRALLSMETLENRTLMACDGFLTYSQGGYGGNGAPANYLTANFPGVFPNGVQIGSQVPGAASGDASDGNRAALFTSAIAINALLPATATDTTPQGLNGDSTDETDASNLGAGTLAGHTLAMMLTLGFDAANDSFDGDLGNGLLGNLIYQATDGTSALNGMTVSAIVGQANVFLSGATTS
ncbi:MAG: hypothetical protein ABL921_28175, partial [Pirellula sp.]